MQVQENFKKIWRKIYNIFFKEEIQKENKFFIAITLVIYMAIICAACISHEAWEDEAQAWLIARDLSPLGIIQQMKFEGHSCMWHFMLLPFAKLGLPFDSIKIIPIIAAAITGYLVLKKSPFNRLTKVCVLFTSTFLYYMPAIVRPYSLIPLLFTIISIMNKDRKKYPILYGTILAIISNIHILVLPFAGMLFLFSYGSDFLHERKKWNKEEKKKFYIGLSIAIAGMLFMAIQAISGYFCSIVKDAGNNYNIFENMMVIFKNLIYYNVGPGVLKLAVIIGIICLGMHSIFISNKQGMIFWTSVIILIVIHVFMWNNLLNQRAVMLFLFIYYYAWNYRYDIDKNESRKYPIFATKIVTIILVSMSISSIGNTYKIIKKDICEPYSGGKEMASYIEENISENSVFITKCFISGTIAYLNNDNYEFYEIPTNRNFTFTIWDRVESECTPADYTKAIQKHKGRKVYIIEWVPGEKYIAAYLGDIYDEIEKNAKLIYKTSEQTSNGVLCLWEVYDYLL